MNNLDTPTTPILSAQPGMTVRIIGDSDTTYTIAEVNPVGKSGKQFRCALICDKTGQMKTGIAPSRLAPPYANKGPKTLVIGGFNFRPEVLEYLPGPTTYHPAMYLAGMLKAPVAAELLDLIVDAAEKDSAKAHAAVVSFCVKLMPLNPTILGPKTFLDKLKFGFSFPEPDRKSFLILSIAKIHNAVAFPGGL